MSVTMLQYRLGYRSIQRISFNIIPRPYTASTILYQTNQSQNNNTTSSHIPPQQQSHSTTSRTPTRGNDMFPWVLLLTCGASLIYFQNRAKQHHIKLNTQSSSLTDDTVKIGGAFELTDMNGNIITSEQFMNKNILLYFGFTHCPDICPIELKKVQSALRLLYMKLRDPKLDLSDTDPTQSMQSNASITQSITNKLQYRMLPQSDEQIRKLMPTPIFVSVDPHRDTPERLREYSKQYMPYIIWATGTYDQLKSMTNKYRAYMNIPQQKNSTDDYLVDHSIYWYFVGPTQSVDDFFGQRVTNKQMAQRMYDQICIQQKNKNNIQ